MSAGAAYESDGYVFAVEPGTYQARLDKRVWGSRGNLRCYFTDLDSSNRFFLSVFWERAYRPAQGGPNFKTDVEDGQHFTLTIGKARTGNPVLREATPT